MNTEKLVLPCNICGTKNRIAEALNGKKKYLCANCKSPLVANPDEPQLLSVTTKDNAPLLSISQLSAKELVEYDFKTVNFKDSQKEHISGLIEPLLQQVPNTAHAINHGMSYIATFSNKATDGMKNGVYVLLKDRTGKTVSILKEAKKGGKFVENARLKGGFSPATGALIVWQVLSFITAQKYLRDIDEKLEKICKGIDSIKNFLEDKRTAEIKANLDYIRKIKYFVDNKKDITDKEDAKYSFILEMSDKQSLEHKHHLKMELDRKTNDFIGRNPRTGKLDKDIQAIKDFVEESVRLITTCLYVDKIRMMNQQLQMSLNPLSENILLIDALKNTKEDLKYYISIINIVYTKAKEYIKTTNDDIPLWAWPIQIPFVRSGIINILLEDAFDIGQEKIHKMAVKKAHDTTNLTIDDIYKHINDEISQMDMTIDYLLSCNDNVTKKENETKVLINVNNAGEITNTQILSMKISNLPVMQMEPAK